MVHLTLDQRYKIEAYLEAGHTISEIAGYVGKDKSAISRELKRNPDQRSGRYFAKLADNITRNRLSEGQV
jgi:IS30 family transposase